MSDAEILHESSKFTDSQVLAIVKQAANGVPVTELRRQHGMSSAAFTSGGQDAAAWTLR